jgi:gluconolactonase
VIPVPEDPSNVEFGGPDRSTLYITAGTGLYRIETTMKGYAIWPK